jgi:cytochrome c-type biogenesis protein CcmH/NrfG
VAYRAGDLVRAQGLAEALLARVPNETESLCLLALLARDRGDSAQALGLLRRALAVDPFHPLARRLLDELASVSHSNE